jgi:hypothetical protein
VNTFELRPRLVMGALSLAAVVACPPATAAASSPERGVYQCWQSGTAYFGKLTIKPASKYTWNGGDPGKYAYKRSSRRVLFKSGDLAGTHWYGKHSIYQNHSRIDLYKHNGQDLYISCFWDKR